MIQSLHNIKDPYKKQKQNKFHSNCEATILKEITHNNYDTYYELVFRYKCTNHYR